MQSPVVVVRPGGFYSTILLPNGVIETLWFGNDGTDKLVGSTHQPTLQEMSKKHIASYESSK
jgi:hypothetical protein